MQPGLEQNTLRMQYLSEFLWATVDDACGTGVHAGVSSMRIPNPAPVILGVQFAIAIGYL
jgi:hypothetical protein